MARSCRQRIDQLLVRRQLVASRTRAQSLVMAGAVFSGSRRIDKPGDLVDVDSVIEVRRPDHPWVSRGGLKLEHALDHFAIDVRDALAVDLGASTGGFVDVLVARGAAHVWAVDVGKGQLAWRLRQSPCVTVLEGVNARALDAELIPESPGIVVADLSFISLMTALPAALSLAAPASHLIALIKPQFEAGRERVGKGGIVRDPAVHRDVCTTIRTWLANTMGWRVLGIVESPVTGRTGNREFLIAARKPG
ncbi:MAG: TlyA family RNA methyltransferase [Alphaproteobacteria bacterium]|nr:TlyA family RNA methyltransferase [Alphaproteobacteria bacterium]